MSDTRCNARPISFSADPPLIGASHDGPVPRFLIEPRGPWPGDLAAVGSWHDRFPEVGIDHRYLTVDDPVGREFWVCRAPSETHIRRWTDALGVPVEVIRRIVDTAYDRRDDVGAGPDAGANGTDVV